MYLSVFGIGFCGVWGVFWSGYCFGYVDDWFLGYV